MDVPGLRNILIITAAVLSMIIGIFVFYGHLYLFIHVTPRTEIVFRLTTGIVAGMSCFVLILFSAESFLVVTQRHRHETHRDKLEEYFTGVFLWISVTFFLYIAGSSRGSSVLLLVGSLALTGAAIRLLITTYRILRGGFFILLIGNSIFLGSAGLLSLHELTTLQLLIPIGILSLAYFLTLYVLQLLAMFAAIDLWFTAKERLPLVLEKRVNSIIAVTAGFLPYALFAVLLAKAFFLGLEIDFLWMLLMGSMLTGFRRRS